MANRSNYQTCSFQCIRPGELWQCNWLEGITSLSHIIFFFWGLLGFVNEWSVSVSRSKVAETDWGFLVCITDNTETGTIVSLVYDIPRKRITTLLAFSKGEPRICLFLGQPSSPPLPPPLPPFLFDSSSFFPKKEKRAQDGPRSADMLPNRKKKRPLGESRSRPRGQEELRRSSALARSSEDWQQSDGQAHAPGIRRYRAGL